jgi:nucleotide-binding universal stress UspA family protein
MGQIAWPDLKPGLERGSLFERIVVPLDGSDESEQIIPYAADLARAAGASLDLLRVVDTTDPVLAKHSSGHSFTQVVGILRSEAAGYLKTVEAGVGLYNVRVNTIVEEGAAATVITDVAGRHPGTVVALATHGKVGLGRLFSGSVADEVLRNTSCPVLLLGPHHAKRVGVGFGAAIVPLDGSELGEKALPLASGLSRALGTDLVLLRVQPASENLLEVATVGTDGAASESDQLALNYLHAVRDDLERQGANSSEQRLVYGKPADGIMEVAGEVEAEHPGTFIIMTTHGRSGALRLALGSVADSVVSSAKQPVLVIHPSG